MTAPSGNIGSNGEKQMNEQIKLLAIESGNYPMEFIGHYLIGGNPNDLEHGFWDTEQDAIINFALQFAKLAENAQGNFLFVRKSPIICEEAMFDSNIKKWKMIGRFSISKLKEKNNG